MLAPFTFVVAMATMATALDIPISRQFHGGFQSEFCYTLPHFVAGWTAHLVFDHSLASLDVSTAEIVKTLNGGKDYVIQNKHYNSNFEAGEKLCLKLTAHTNSGDQPKGYFYIEGIDHPIDEHGHTHPIPKTTVDPQLAHVHPLWVLKNIPNSATDPLSAFHPQKSGGFDEGSLGIANDPSGHAGKVLRVFYAKGSYVRVHTHRGAQFYAHPVDPRTSMTLSYDIYFSKGFDFVKGGKLPGLYGGATNCSGGRHSDSCFSARLMWRENGDGEVYGYIPEHQAPGFCDKPDNICNPVYGSSIARGSWRFKTGVWQNIAVHITLNTPGQLNGKVKIWHDGQPKLSLNNLNFRSNNDLKIEGLFFSTFFGGSDTSWAAGGDCYTYYKNFVLSAADDNPAIIG
ncbi:uncharacterized protein [Littorina saxatilis]|uniref:Polysaccharide lyase 14 domain-containing protein n=1 Tax=Littorina saxatilis TaxID=31220 RepID=A0AAN9AU77_9CAEN